MKKYLKLFLILGMTFSLVGCGNSNDKKEPDNSELTQGENNNQDLTPVFDTSWASNDFEKKIPEPFFEVKETKWIVENAVYVLYGEKYTDEIPVDDARTYAKQLSENGYGDDELVLDHLDIDGRYAYVGWNAKTNYGVYVVWHDIPLKAVEQYIKNGSKVGAAVSIGIFDASKNLEENNLPADMYDFYTKLGKSKPNNNSQNSNDDKTTSFDTSWASNDFEKLIPEPPKAKYFTNENENDYLSNYNMQASNIERDEVVAYVNKLKEAGFTANANELPNGDGKCSYFYQGYSESNKNHSIEVQIKDTPDGGTQLLITISINK